MTDRPAATALHTKSSEVPLVIPAKAGIHGAGTPPPHLDTRFRGCDGLEPARISHRSDFLCKARCRLDQRLASPATDPLYTQTHSRYSAPPTAALGSGGGKHWEWETRVMAKGSAMNGIVGALAGIALALLAIFTGSSLGGLFGPAHTAAHAEHAEH